MTGMMMIIIMAMNMMIMTLNLFRQSNNKDSGDEPDDKDLFCEHQVNCYIKFVLEGIWIFTIH